LFNTALSGPEVETLYNNGSPTQTLANIPQSSNLKAWYKLDATEIYNGTTTEWEVNNSSNPSIYNNFINFNNKWMKVYPIGSGNNGEGGLILPDTYTISLWAKMNSDTAGFFEGTLHTGGFHPGWGNPFRYNAIVNGKWRLYNAGSVIYVTSDITDGKWHHILLTYSSSTTTLTVYTDNIQTFTSSSRNYGTENNIGRIGSGSDGNSNFTGNISNISIWDGVVTTSQRGELYNNGAPKDLINNSNYSNLKHWYIFNSQETGIRTLIDQKGSNNLLAYSQHTPTFGFINTLAGESTGMSQSNLVQSDLQTVAPYSKYALDFDGNDYIDCGNSADFSFGNGTTDSPFSTSFWFKLNSNSATIPFLSKMTVGKEWTISVFGGNGIRIFLKNLGTNNQQSIDSTTTFSTGVWYHAITTYDGRGGANAADGLSIYINGSLDAPTNVIKQTYTAMSSSSSDVTIGKYGGTYINGVMSNVAIWDTALSTSEVREIYNEGLPSNLNTFSGTAPIAWWQLGENSSFNGNDWIVADEIGSNNGESDGMGVDALTNGVGTTANGTSTGMSEGSLIGDAPYSTANAISSGMPVTARGKDVPATIYSIAFDGVDQYMSFTNINNDTLRYAFSVSFWVKYDRYTAIPFGGSGKSWMRIMNATQQKLDINNGGSVWATGATNSLDQWHHYVIRRDANNLITTFVDGELYTNNAPTLAGRFLPTYLGAMKLNEFLEGKMTQVSMFDFELSESNVTAMYDNGIGYDISSLNPVNWWKMDEGSGTTVENHGSWSTNSGTLVNGASWSSDTP
jgi:hypothetical protein